MCTKVVANSELSVGFWCNAVNLVSEMQNKFAVDMPGRWKAWGFWPM